MDVDGSGDIDKDEMVQLIKKMENPNSGITAKKKKKMTKRASITSLKSKEIKIILSKINKLN